MCILADSQDTPLRGAPVGSYTTYVPPKDILLSIGSNGDIWFAGN